MTTRHRASTPPRKTFPRKMPRAMDRAVLVVALLPTLLGVATPAVAQPSSAVRASYESTGYGTPEGSPGTPAWSETAYTYFRVVEGTATLFPAETGDPEADQPQEVVPNQPVLTGDLLRVDPGSRVELVLSDDDLLRVGGGTEVRFERISGSPDTEDRQTVLYVPEGEIQMVVFEKPVSVAGGSQPASIETPAARIVLREPGSYRISTGGVYGAGSTRVTVRDGVAELVTDHGSVLVRQGDEARIESGEHPRVAFANAPAEDSLELWGRALWEEAAQADTGPVDRSLRYSATRLRSYGDWVHVDGRAAWRPRVAADWYPYRIGSWAYTPSGFLWVSNEPWGWLPYHYGTWALDPGYGWLWYPGDVFSPAWVYWYWGPTEVAWVPIGYYSHHYAHLFRASFGLHFGFRFGLYGFAGGSPRFFRDWVFCDYRNFHRRHLHSFAHRGFGFDRRTRRDVVPRGVVTTDTRGFDRRERLDPRRIAQDLPRRLATRRGGELPDVTPFVAREPRLSPDLERRLVSRQPDSRLAGTPLAPGTRRLGVTRPDTPPARPTAPRRVTPRGDARDSAPRTLSRGTPSTPRAREALPTTPRRRETTPHASVPRATSPRATAPRTLRPRTVEPRTTPRSTSPGETSRRLGSPRETSPRVSSPRDTSPRTRPRTVQPRRITPRSTPDTPRATTPRATTPRATAPRATRPRATTPRSSSPRPSTPRATSPRAVAPRPTRPGTVTPRSTTPRSTTPRATAPRSSTPRTAPRSPTARRPSVQPRSSSGVRRSSPSRSAGGTPRSGLSSRRASPSAGGRSSASGRSTSRSTGSRSSGGHGGVSRGRSGSSHRSGASRSRGSSHGSRSSGGSRRGSARRGGGG
jgi:hypothetical protein